MGDLHIPPVCPSSSVRGRRIYEGAMAVMKKSRDIRIAAMIQGVQEFKRPESRGCCLCLYLAKPNGRP